MCEDLYALVCMCSCVCMYAPEADVRCFPPSFSTLQLKQDLNSELTTSVSLAHQFAAGMPSLPPGLWDYK